MYYTLILTNLTDGFYLTDDIYGKEQAIGVTFGKQEITITAQLPN